MSEVSLPPVAVCEDQPVCRQQWGKKASWFLVEFGPSIARKLCRASLLDLDARLPARPRREWLWRFRFNLGIYRVNIYFFATQVRLGVRAGSLFWAYLVQLRPRDSKTYVPSQHNQTRSRETMSWNLLGPSQHVQYFFADFGTCCSAKTFVYFDWSPTWHFKAIALTYFAKLKPRQV